MATEIEADELYILTAVPKVALNFGKPNQHFLDVLTTNEAKKYLDEGHFPKGSMGPKIEAAITFLENGGKRAIITSVDKMSEAIEGHTGTEIVPDVSK